MGNVFLLRHSPVDDAGEDAGLHPHMPAQHQVVEDCHSAEKRDVLECSSHSKLRDLARLAVRDVLSFEHDLAGVRPVKAREHVEERRLPRSVRTDYRKYAAAGHAQRDFLNGGNATELLGQSDDVKDRAVIHLVAIPNCGHGL